MPYDGAVIAWLEDPMNEQEVMTASNLQRQTIRRLLNMSTEQAAAEIAVGSYLNPTASPALITGSYMAGVPAEDDMIAQAAALEQEQTRTIGGVGGFFGRIGDIARGITRWTALAFHGLYDEAINRPLRTMANMNQGMGLGEAYSESGNAPLAGFGEAIAAAFDPNTHVNIGSGWLPSSNLAAPVQQALAQIDEDAQIIASGDLAARDELYGRYSEQYGFIPQTTLPDAQQQMVFQSQMRERIMDQASNFETPLGQAQQKLGTPVTQRQSAEADSVLMNLNSLGTDGPNYSQVSIGRVFAGLVTESGTEPFHYLSGGLDFMSNIFLDPANIAGGFAAKAARARRTVGVGEQGASVVAGVEEAAGVTDMLKHIDELKQSPEYLRYQGWSEKTRRRADELANRGVTPEQIAAGEASETAAKLQRHGSVANEIRNLERQVDEIIRDPDYIKYQEYQPATKNRLNPDITDDELAELQKLNPGLATQHRRARRAAQIDRQAADIGARIDELAATPEYTKFAGWKPSTQEKALKLAREADVDATKNPRLAEQQRVARKAMETMDEIEQGGRAADELREAADWLPQIKQAAGIVDGGPRKTVNQIKVNSFITGKTAERWVDAFMKADAVGVDKLLSHIRTSIPLKLRRQLTEATTREEVIAALMPHIGGVISETGLAGRATTALLKNPATRLHRVVNDRVVAKVGAGLNATTRKPLYSGSKLKRLFSEMSPRNLDLDNMAEAYEGLIAHARNIGWERGDEALEAHLDAFRHLEDGDYSGAFEIFGAYQKNAIERLTANGLDKDVAEAVTRFISMDDQHRLYFIDRAGNLVHDNQIMISGAMEEMPKPHLISELFKGNVFMPDARLVRHAANELDVVGRIMNTVATKGAGEGFKQRALVRMANSVMTRAWKPAVLLRVAWPVRVIGEEQMRMAAAGISQPFTHPIHMISRLLADRKFNDVLGDAMAHSDEWARASARRVAFQGDYQQWGARAWRPIDRRYATHTQYRDAMLGELQQLWTDPIVRELFRTDASLSAADRTRKVADWLFRDKEGRQLLDKLAQVTDEGTRKAIGTDYDAVLSYVESAYARAHGKAGGRWQLHHADGTIKDDTGRVLSPDEIPEGYIPPGRATYVVTEPGLEILTNSYGSGKLGDVRVGGKLGENPDVLAKHPDLVDANEIRKVLNGIISDDDTARRLPNVYKGTETPSSGDINKFDEVVSQLFDLLMSTPTNALSRHVTFREYYWQHLGEMAHVMDDATLAAARKGAKEAGYLSRFNEAEKLRRVDSKVFRRSTDPQTRVGLITDLNQADEAAKAMALTRVQDLLFDVSKRKNASDALSIIMPFADAWGEVLGTWIRIMKQENVKPFRRVQQVIESGRESDIGDPASGYTNEGFFRNDGDREVFTIPGLNRLWQALSGSESDWEYGLGSLSIATEVLPGVGPVVQMAAQPIIPDEPHWDWLREIVSPYGSQSIQKGLTPSSWQRVIAAFDWSRNTFSDPELIRLYNSAVMDALNVMSRDDPQFQAKIGQNRDAVLADARAMARGLFLTQALARFVGPAAPSSRPTIEDKDGKVWLQTVLHDEYYELLQKHDRDTLAATEEFIATFGIDPWTFSGSKTVAVHPRGQTAISHNFERANPELFVNFPDIAYYLGPAYLDDYAPFDWGAYSASIASGARESITPEEFLDMKNDSKGRLAYDHYRRELEATYGEGRSLSDAGWDTTTKKKLAQHLRAYDNELMQRFPGYTGQQFGTEVAGIPSRVSHEQQISQMQSLFEYRPDLLELGEDGQPVNPAVYAAWDYMNHREQAIFTSDYKLAGTFGDSGKDDPESTGFQIRQILRSRAAKLIQAYPEFGPLWEQVFARELYDDYEEELTVQDVLDMIAGSQE